MPDVQTNWQRGLLRTWLVASALWVLGMGWVQYGHQAKPEPKGITIQLSEEKGMRIDTGEEEISSDVCDQYFDEEGRPKKFSAVFKYRNKDDCLADISARHSARLAEQTHRLGLMFLPPLLLLLAFPLLRWLLRGFKAN